MKDRIKLVPDKPACPYCGGYGGAHYKDCPTYIWEKQ